MQVIKEYPVYVAFKKENLGHVEGNYKYWSVVVKTDGVDWYTATIYWQDLANGRESVKQSSANTLISKKNIGKSNETSLEAQAYIEADQLILKQTNKGYRLTVEELGTFDYTLPMLAHDYFKKQHLVKFPLNVERKMDGVRALAKDGVMWSRSGKPFIKECFEHLLFDTQGFTFDGELILPAPFTFQETISAIKKFDKLNSPKLQYHIYDVVAPELDTLARKEIIKKIVPKDSNLIIVESTVVNDELELAEYHAKVVAEGYEGVIIRIPGQGYEINKRSTQLLKYKSFDDSEFEVIGVKEGEGKFLGSAILICKTIEGKEFDATPVGTMESRRAIFNNAKEYTGTFWKIKHFGWTDENKPRFPIALTIRNKEVEG